MEPPGPNLLRIAISTDNHLGFLEKDPVRGCDSFLAFEEALDVANRERVDMVLLGGDVFHENRPSRPAMHRAIGALRARVLGDGEVTIAVVSDQKLAFAANGGHVNYEDPHYNVRLPVFAIHGNHDDPAREANTGRCAVGACRAAAPGFTRACALFCVRTCIVCCVLDGAFMSFVRCVRGVRDIVAGRPLAALDVLAGANLVNYFGRSEIEPEVRVAPVLIRKGAVRLALYGLGAIRDERLNRCFRDGKVVFERPAEDADAWFNVFVLHQNRGGRGRGSTNAIEEGVLPDWMVRGRARAGGDGGGGSPRRPRSTSSCGATSTRASAPPCRRLGTRRCT